jgi:hypothetical protein
MTLADYTETQLFRMYRKLYRKLERACSGGLAFGADWSAADRIVPALRPVYSAWYAKVQQTSDPVFAYLHDTH